MEVFTLILGGISLLLKTIPIGTDLYFKIQQEKIRWEKFQADSHDERNAEWAAVRAEAKSYYDRLMAP